MITDRPHRLTGVSYVGFQRYFVTTCTAFRKTLFNDHALATEVIQQILQLSREFEFAVVAYCVMPDHLHLLL
jgi:REP element-mobilizing transposase RayT